MLRYLTRTVPFGHSLTYTSQRSINLCELRGYRNRAAKDLVLLWCGTWSLNKFLQTFRSSVVSSSSMIKLSNVIYRNVDSHSNDTVESRKSRTTELNFFFSYVWFLNHRYEADRGRFRIPQECCKWTVNYAALFLVRSTWTLSAIILPYLQAKYFIK